MTSLNIKASRVILIVVILAILLLVPIASADAFSQWTFANGCWTSTNDTYTRMMWNSTGDSSWSTPAGVTSVNLLAVAGGGGAGGHVAGTNAGSGGGAGGFRYVTGFGVSGLIKISVGAHGTGGTSAGTKGSNGGNSSFGVNGGTEGVDLITARGGGGGAASSGVGVINGNDGGSGGGGGWNGVTQGTVGAASPAGQGSAGGLTSGNDGGAGAGGGANSVGGASSGVFGGPGGNGKQCPIDGNATWYAGGGGGGSYGAAAGPDGQGLIGKGGTGTTTSTTASAGGDGNDGIAIALFHTPSTLVADFTTNVSSGPAPLTVAFTDTSTNTTTVINAYSWVFGDLGAGNTSALQNPTHVYTSPGTYTANLTISNVTLSASSSKTKTITANVTLSADFVGAPTSGFVPQAVSFADLSTGAGIYAWNWSFGDGTYSEVQNPAHTYTTAGAFPVSLTVTGLDGTNTKTVSPYINIAAGSAFIGEPNFSTTYALGVRFTDLYPTNHLTWNWSFGDTYYNTTQNPRHFYSVADRYNVSLTTTTTAFGTNTTSITNYINLTSDLPNVVSWMHMDGSPGGTTFTDLQGNAWLAVAATTQVSPGEFGTASGQFAAVNSRLSTPTSSAFNFGTSNFTIEQWVNLSSSGNNQFIISRTTNAATRVDGWGLYHSTASGTSNAWVFWLGNAATGSTGTFTIPLNQRSHVVIQRTFGTVVVSVNGVAVASASGLSGNYDTSNGIAYGNPLSGGAVSSAQMFLDETRISNVARWATSSGPSMLFSPPTIAYNGDLFPTAQNPNPGSVLRFKTDPSIPSAATIANGTNRQRTTQIQNVNITNNISVTEIFPATHIFIAGVTANSTTYSGINFTFVNIDNSLGVMQVNMTRPGGFSTTGLTSSRASIFDANTIYYNYTPPNDIDYSEDIQYFGNGFLGNLTNGVYFPVTNFIATNVTYLDWVTYSNFTISNNAPIVLETPVVFIPRNNWSANQFDWDFGDGTVINNDTAGLETHIYTTPGTYSVSLRSYLWQNGSVTNSTTLTNSITAVYNASYVKADFVGTPTSGSPGLNVAFTDLSVFGASNATSGRTYNWSFGDNGFTLQPYSNTIGNVNHVYTNLGTFTVTLRVNNTLNSSTEMKLNYITISTSQNANTWYTQRLVRLKALTAQGVPIMGANISAVFLSSSLPNTSISWIQSAFGVTAAVAQQMLDGSLLMSDITGGDGSTTFMMFPGIRYGISIQNATSGLNFHTTILPNDNDYMIYCPDVPTFSQNITQRQLVNTSLFITEPNNTYITFNIIYQDNSGLTSNVRWNVTEWDNMTPMYYKDFGNPLTLPVSDSYTVPNIRGQQWKFWYNATRSGLA